MHLKNYPDCFPSLQHYAQWVKAALAAREATNPCEDCSSQYRDDMLADKRCRPVSVPVVFAVQGIRQRRKDEDFK